MTIRDLERAAEAVGGTVELSESGGRQSLRIQAPPGRTWKASEAGEILMSWPAGDPDNAGRSFRRATAFVGIGLR